VPANDGTGPDHRRSIAIRPRPDKRNSGLFCATLGSENRLADWPGDREYAFVHS
jgi:hypothetical protein